MRIAVIHPNIMCAGGAEVTGLMVLEYCQDLGDVYFITDNKVDFNVLNEKFSTHIVSGKIVVERPYLCRLIGKLEPRIHLFAKLQLTLFSRYVKKHKDEYDLIISTKQEADFGKPGIQFLHHPPDGYKMKFYDGMYLWVLARLGRKSEGIAQNITISPSKYIDEMYHSIYGGLHHHIESFVLYPAIRKCSTEVDWDKRENGFVMTGAIDKLKRTDKAIEVMDGIHESTGAHLHIIGKGTGDYYRMVQRMAKNRDYVHLEGFVSTERYFELLTAHKYGIHMRENEPSAVTVRELVDCGMIVFAHESGGTPEILNYNKHLLFKDIADANYKILRVMLEEYKHTTPGERMEEKLLKELKMIKFNTREDWKKEFEKLLYEKLWWPKGE
jgi:hypothetical protein